MSYTENELDYLKRQLENIDSYKMGYNQAKSTLFTKEDMIDFAEWISKNDWMSMWVEDKWMWEYQSSEYGEELPSTHKWFGYKTNEQLFELYKASKK